jgi:hypothetical protein
LGDSEMLKNYLNFIYLFTAAAGRIAPGSALFWEVSLFSDTFVDFVFFSVFDFIDFLFKVKEHKVKRITNVAKIFIYYYFYLINIYKQFLDDDLEFNFFYIWIKNTIKNISFDF